MPFLSLQQSSSPAHSRNTSMGQTESNGAVSMEVGATSLGHSKQLFSAQTKTIVWGMQSRAVQGMLDFDYSCSRPKPSVVAMMYPFVYVFYNCTIVKC